MYWCVNYFMENIYPRIFLFPGFIFYDMFQFLDRKKKTWETKSFELIENLFF